jgi:hypothetical protein
MTMDEPTAAERWDTSVSFIFGVRFTCTYCGNPADGLDHVMPWTVITSRERHGRGHRGDSVGVRTYACRQCNSILGNKIFPTMWLRIMHVNGRLRALLADHMAYKIWTREEMIPMGPNLRRQCEVKTLLRRVAGARIGWPYDPVLLEMLLRVRADVSDPGHPHYRDFLARFFSASVVPEGDGG